MAGLHLALGGEGGGNSCLHISMESGPLLVHLKVHYNLWGVWGYSPRKILDFEHPEITFGASLDQKLQINTCKACWEQWLRDWFMEVESSYLVHLYCRCTQSQGGGVNAPPCPPPKSTPAWDRHLYTTYTVLNLILRMQISTLTVR